MGSRKPFLETILGVVIAARRTAVGGALLGLMTVGACTPDAGPTGPETVVPNFGWNDGLTKLEEELLKQIEESEKRRIKAAEEGSKAAYDSLKVLWQAFRDAKPDKDASPLLVCDPLQYKGEVKIIGRDGGDIDFGPHKLRIPQGALDRATVITAELLTSLHVEARFSPHGLVFKKPPVLLVSYKHCYTPADFSRRTVVYLNSQGEIVERPVSWDYPSYKDVAAEIWHFSRYAVAY